MRVPSRVPEVTAVTRLLDGLKEIHYVTPPATIDGGDVLQIEDRVFVGISPRTNLHAVAQLRAILGQHNVEIIPVTVHNTMHLKSVCTSLGSHHILYTKGYFDTKLLRDYTRIVVPSTEKYAANCFAINGTVLMAKGYPMTNKLIETEGFTIEELEMSEFRKGEGALTCLSIIL
jgi:dimethylargininase